MAVDYLTSGFENFDRDHAAATGVYAPEYTREVKERVATESGPAKGFKKGFIPSSPSRMSPFMPALRLLTIVVMQRLNSCVVMATPCRRARRRLKAIQQNGLTC